MSKKTQNQMSSKTQKWLEASHTQYGQGSTTPQVPAGETREDKDILSVYEAAAQNAVGIEKRAQNAQLQANKAFDLTQKYLAAQNQANGFTGLGISDTGVLRASSQYQQALADANSTREQSLFENYRSAQEDVNTIRGEWASKEESEKEKIRDAVMYNENIDAVKKYLSANGIEEGTNDYNAILSEWELQNSSVGDNENSKSKDLLKEFTDGKILNSKNHEDSNEWGAIVKIDKNDKPFTLYNLVNAPEMQKKVLGSDNFVAFDVLVDGFKSMAKQENEGKIFSPVGREEKYVCIDGKFYRVTLS